jgi:metallo-beta-lactamase family protein
MPAPDTTYLGHGAPKAAGFLQERIRERLRWTAVVPRQGEKVLLP